MVTSRSRATPGLGVSRFISVTARALLIRTLRPVVLGYSRKDSHTSGGRSATNDVTCWLNSAARYRSSYTGSFSHGTTAHICAPSSRFDGTSSSSHAAALVNATRPCRSSEHSPYGSRETMRAASTVPSVPAAPPSTGAASRSGSGSSGRLCSAARSSRTASRSQAAVRCSRSRSDSSGGCEPGQVTKTAPYVFASVATGSAASEKG